jgi:hypothetical protein
MAPAKLQPALLGGLAMGVLSALPFINLPNCCCAWILFGGGLAAYLMQQNHPEPITPGDGAIVGLLAGVVGAVVWAGLSIPIGLMMGPLQGAFVERMLENASDVPPEVREMIENMRGGAFAIGVGTIAVFFASLFIGTGIGAVFGALGGLLGAVIFRKDVPPSMPPPPPPPSVWTPPPAPVTPPPPPPPPPDVPGTV